MLWRSKSNKNRTAHAGVEPAGDSGQQPDTAKPAPQAEQVVPQQEAPRQPGVPEGDSTAGTVTGAPQSTGAPTTAPGVGAPQHHTVDDALKQVLVKGEKNEFGQFMEFEPITIAPIDLDAINVELMKEDEKAYLNEYHKMVFDTVSPFLTTEETNWLKEYTRAI